jgi:hypothetical protein
MSLDVRAPSLFCTDFFAHDRYIQRKLNSPTGHTMINLNELSSEDLEKILQLRRQMEAIELEIVEVIENAKKKELPLGITVRNMQLPRQTQPSLRELISGILETAGTPLTVQEIYDASLKTGYQWQSRDPINALNVKIYTDKTFRKTTPGRFVLRKKG